MTEAQIISHWRKGAREALQLARRAHEDGSYSLALFNCHLAMEKALKAAIMEKTQKPHPKIHNLGRLAALVKSDWTLEEQELFDTLSPLAHTARYDDLSSDDLYADGHHAVQWIERVTAFFSRHMP